MVAQTHPFKPIPEKLDMPWKGVHKSDPLRDDPDHPHSLFGEGHKNTFHEGGIIPDAVGFSPPQQALSANAFGQQTALDAQARRRPATTQAAPVVPPLPAQAGAVSRSRRQQRFADGGEVKKKKANLVELKELPIVLGHSRELAEEIQGRTTRQDTGAHLTSGRALAKASRRRAPGHAAGSEQDILQRRLAGSTSARELIRATKEKNKKKKKQTTGTKDITAKTAAGRLKGRALQIENAERKARGLPPLKE